MEEVILDMGLEREKAFWQWFSRWQGEGHRGEEVHDVLQKGIT